MLALGQLLHQLTAVVLTNSNLTCCNGILQSVIISPQYTDRSQMTKKHERSKPLQPHKIDSRTCTSITTCCNGLVRCCTKACKTLIGASVRHFLLPYTASIHGNDRGAKTRPPAKVVRCLCLRAYTGKTTATAYLYVLVPSISSTALRKHEIQEGQKQGHLRPWQDVCDEELTQVQRWQSPAIM